MGLKSILKTTLKVAGGQALPLAETFGVPGARNVREAVELIDGDRQRDNQDQVKLLAETVDALDRRVQILEAFIDGARHRND